MPYIKHYIVSVPAASGNGLINIVLSRQVADLFIIV
jgi:hypothetical protein